MREANLRERTWEGIKFGLVMASCYAAYVCVLYLLRGAGPFQRAGVTLPAVLGAYFGGGILAGALVGALSPWTDFFLGRLVVTWMATTPVALLLGMTVMDPSDWRRDLLKVTAMYVGTMGTAIGIITWVRREHWHL